MKVLYLGVKSAEYPRNRTIRDFLAREHYVKVVPIDPRDGFVRNAIQLLRAVVRSHGYDVVILARVSHQFLLIAWLAARRMRAVLVVDLFVGLYETRVLDERKSSRSVRAFIYWVCDKSAFAFSDVALIDTHFRAAEAKRRFNAHDLPLVIPVGAPPWAISRAMNSPGAQKELRVLYYGNYLPLHGLETVINECALARKGANVALTLVGDGRERPRIEMLVDRLQGGAWCRFLAPVAEPELADLIYDHDVVLGTFGTSLKANGVIANKTWQGIACGRIVVTKDTPALVELSAIAGPQLIGTGDEPGRRLQDVLVEIARRQEPFDFQPNLHLALREHVDEHLTRMMAVLEDQVIRRKARRFSRQGLAD